MDPLFLRLYGWCLRFFKEASENLYLWVYIGRKGPLREEASVIKVQDRR